jgi:acetylornithine deacetylase/succinyl-diaminopimelate desuccinylase-like protein
MEEAWLDELAQFVRIPSISADPAHAADVTAAAEWVAAFVRQAGGDAQLVPWGERPLVVGEIAASDGTAASAPTVLLYGHFDVQPPEPLDHWESDPFELDIRGDWAYGRGIADDKGQLYALLKAGATLAAEGRLPVNLRVVCDGEEEVGGHSVVEFLEQDERGADAGVIFDSAMIRRGVPSFAIGTRGLAYLHVTVRTGERDLHSGLYGGAALNAAHALARTLTGVVPRNGRLPEPLLAGVVPPTEEELASWRELPPGDEELSSQGARPADPAAADEFYLRTFAGPSLDVNGIETGSPHLQKTVLPVVAVANLSIRLAPGQHPDEIGGALERLLREAAPEGTDVEVEHWSSSLPGVVSPDAEAIRIGLDAFERALGKRPLVIRIGGSLPIVPALVAKGIPTIVTGFAVPDSNIHSPNERMLVEYLPLAVRAATELFVSFAKL